MRTSTKAVIGVAVVMAVVTAGGLVYAAKTGPGDRPLRGRWAEKLALLGVTEQQRDHIRGIVREHRPGLEPLVKQYVAERRALRDAIHGETVDEKAIRAQASKVAKAGADLALARAKVAHEVRAVLTPEDRKSVV